jgi:hypothetical protein
LIEGLLKEQVAQIAEYLARRPKPALALVGRTGTGKTAALHIAAKEVGFNVWSVDPLTDDLSVVVERMKLKPIVPTMIHVSAADELGRSEVRMLVEAAKRHRAFLVLESTRPIEHEDVMEVQFYKPKARDVARLAEELKIPFENIKMYDDLRQVMLAQHGSMGYEEGRSTTKEVEQGLRRGRFEEADDRGLSLLLDSAHLNFFGRDLFFFVKAIQAADKCKRPEPLSGFKVVKPTIVSHFLEKLKLSGRKA